MGPLEGRVAVVTGASEGIGVAIVRRLAAEGMKVAALARRIDKLTETQGILLLSHRSALNQLPLAFNASDAAGKGGWGFPDSCFALIPGEEAQFGDPRQIVNRDLEKELSEKDYTVNGYLCDVQREYSVKDAFCRIEEDFGGIHVLVNNAATGALVEMLNINLENASAILNTNVYGVLCCTKEALNLMKDHSILDGHIVNINSIAGHRAPLKEHCGVYSASKHALRVITESLRADIIKKQLRTRVTCISPGLVRTSMTEYFVKQHSNLPVLKAEDIADALVYALTVPSNVNISDIIIDPA